MICAHLKPVLDSELALGNKIQSKETGWSNAVLVINLENKVDIHLYNEILKNNSPVEYWENDDKHYKVQAGLFCKRCSQSLAWPK